jgi:hypothetical protein
MPVQVSYFNSTHRAWVVAGQFTAGDRQLEITEPIVWPNYSLDTPTDASSCPPGTFFPTGHGDGSCVPCPPGKFTSVAGRVECSPCDPGTFCDRPGCRTCSACGVHEWQNATGSTTCNACPLHARALGQGSTSLSSCTCDVGYHRFNSEPGKRCYPCPEGGICEGGAARPYPDTEHWGDSELLGVSLREGESEEELHERLRLGAFLKCKADGRCDNDCPSLDEPNDAEGGCEGRCVTFSAVFSDCLHHSLTVTPRLCQIAVGTSSLPTAHLQCRSNVSELCSPAYTGVMCEECSLGYFKFAGLCFDCMEPAWLFSIGCILLVALAWYVINR